MKKTIILISLILGCTYLLSGQSWNWSEHLKCDGNVMPLNILTDNNNNTYLCGYYGSYTLMIGSDTIHNLGSQDGFICKFDEDGNLQWLKRIGGSSKDEIVSLSIINNTLYVLGNYQSPTIYFSPTTFLTNDNNYDSYLARYELNGNFIGVTKIFGGTDQQRSKNMAYDINQNCLIITTAFKTEIRYTDNNGSVVLPARSVKDLMTVKSNLSGIILDTTVHTVSVSNTTYFNVNLSNDGGYYLTGDLFGTVYFDDSHSITGYSTSNSDAFFIKLDQDLNFQWAHKGGGTGYDHVNSSISDKYGNLYLAGKCEGTITFDSTSVLQSHSLSTYGAQDLYIAKYNKLGTLQWIKRKGDAGDDDAYGLAQRENLVQFCGNISGQVIFNTDTLTSSGISDVNTGFAILNTSGNEIGAQGIGGTGTDRGELITFLPNGNTIISGYFNSSSISIGDSIYTDAIPSTSDGFIASYYYPMDAVFTYIKTLGCAGVSNGELIVTPYFGVGPYVYSWSPNVTNHNDSLAYNLSAGTYSVTVTDSRDSVATTSIILSAPAALDLGAVQTDVDCYPSDGISNNGSINLSVTGGTGEYTYNWEAISGSGVVVTAEDQTTLTVGIYAVYVTDASLCEASDTFYVNGPAKIAFGGSTVIDETIPPGADGSIDLAVTGGTPAYTFSWTGPSGFNSTDEDIDSLFAGSYQIVIEDIKACSSDTTFMVLNDTMLIAYISDKMDIDCRGNSNGYATVSLINGTGPYTYHWENNLGNTVDGDSPTIINLPADIYFVTVTDNSDSRTATTSVQLFEPSEALSSNIINTEILCYGYSNGVADLTVAGGILPYSYSWSNGRTEEDILNIGAGTYYVTVTDDNGCTIYDEVTLVQPGALDIIITTDQPILCNGDMSGIVTASATGGTGLKTYIWDDPGNQTNQTATNLEAGTYHVTATDINECSIVEQVQLIEPSVLTLSENHTDVSCFGEEDGVINLSVDGGTPTFNYEWSSGQITQDIADLAPDTFYVTVTDAHNCIANTSAIISEPTELVISNVAVNGNDVTVTVSGGTPPYSYSLGGSLQNTTGVFTDVPGGTYNLSVTDDNSCGPETVNGIVIPPDALENHESDLFKVYPNPSNGIFTIELIAATVTEYRIQVFSADGSLVFDDVIDQGIENNNKLAIDLSREMKGIYLLKINGISVSNKLVIQ